jgi:hypothetical protein
MVEVVGTPSAKAAQLNPRLPAGATAVSSALRVYWLVKAKLPAENPGAIELRY